jgi:hypothetical protein
LQFLESFKMQITALDKGEFNMANEWYYMIDNVKSGPVSAQKLKQLAAAKQIDDRYLLLRDGMKTWVKASNVKGLFQMQAEISQSLPPFQKNSKNGILIQDEVSPKVDNSKINKGLSFRKKHPIANFFGVIFMFYAICCIPLFPSNDGRHYNGLIDFAKEYLSQIKTENLTVQTSNKKDAVEELLIQGAKEFNKRLPMMIDKNMRLDTTIPGPGRNWTFFVTLINLSSTELDQTSLREQIQTRIQDRACSSNTIKPILEDGVQIIYTYSGSDGKFIGDIIVNRNDCS